MTSSSSPDVAGPQPVSQRTGRPDRLRTPAIILLGDIIAVVVTGLIFGTEPFNYEFVASSLLLLSCLMWGLYHNRMSLHVLDDLPRLLAASVMAGAIAAAIFALLRRSALSTEDQIFLATLVVDLLIARTASYWVVRERRRRGHLSQRTAILGAGQVGRDLGHYMVSDRSYGCDLVGYVDAAPALPEEELPAPVLGSWDQIAAIVEQEQVDRLVVTFVALRESELVPIMQTCDRADVDIYIVPRLFELTTQLTGGDEIDGIQLQRLHRAPFRSPTWWLKRLFDITVTAIVLLVLSPLLLILALVDRIVDGPGVIFRQPRVGVDGFEFELLKFRSLRPASEEESATNWNISHDNRVSWYGKLLRRTSLDELPQLWNILRGDMSLVGPRPERPHFVAQFSDEYPRYWARHRVPCGLTGWAQIHGLRGDTSIQERARYDNYYIQNWSLWLDVKIMLRTLRVLMKGAG